MTTTKLNLNILILLILFGISEAFSQQFERTEITRTTKSVDYIKDMDVDGDGDRDILISKGDYNSIDTRANAIQWIENLGNLEFGMIRDIAVGVWGYILPNDIDSDGDEDILYSDIWGSTYLLRNNGSLSFTEELISTSWAKVFYLEDLDGDDLNDLVFVEESPGHFSYFPGNGDGTFGDPVNIATSEGYGRDVLVIDYDNDDDNDIIAVTSEGVDKWLNDGNGNYVEDGIIHNNTSTVFVRAIDTGMDGTMDIFMSAGPDLKIYHNDGNGAFSLGQTASPFVSLTSIKDAEAVDINGNGFTDILSGSFSVSNFLQNWNSYVVNDEWDYLIVSDLHIADMDGDGSPDILLASNDDDRVILMHNDQAYFVDFEKHNLSFGMSSNRDFDYGDIDGNGLQDFVVFSKQWLSQSNTDLDFSVILNSGFDNYHKQEINGSAGSFGASIEIVDIDNNLVKDIIMEKDGDGFIYSHDADDNTINLDNFFQGSVLDLFPIDINMDGAVDLLVSNGGNTMSYRLNENGDFDNETILFNITMENISATDINGDNIDDLVFTDEDYRLLWVNGALILENPTFDTISYSLNIDEFTAIYRNADVDADGDIDIIGRYFNHQIILYTNDGNGQFTITTISDSVEPFNGMELDDIDLDGLPDLIMAHGNMGLIGWRKNLGGYFAPESTYISDVLYPSRIRVDDFNYDGIMDVAVLSGLSPALVVYSGTTIYGCMDIEACNYNPEAVEDNVTCVYGTSGCTNPWALTFDPNAICDDGSCEFPLTGFIYNDLNEDGNHQIGEPGAPNVEISIIPGSLSVYSDTDGQFNLTIGDGDHILTAIENENYPICNTVSPLAVSINAGVTDQELVEFGMFDGPPQYQIASSLFTATDLPACENYLEVTIAYQNIGNSTFTGIIVLDSDDQFIDDNLISPVDSIVDGLYYFSFYNLQPGVSENKQINLLFPGSDFIGNAFSLSASIIRLDGAIEIPMAENYNSQVLSCSYDPNDKAVNPQGIGEEGYVDLETKLEYRVRFQNTGNAPAVDVIIYDSLNTNLDLSTFEFVASSHPVMVSINNSSNVAQFLFDDILLPDSVNDEPNSHGFIVYSIDPVDDLVANDEIINTAAIYFDNNDPVITNSVLNTIYECILFTPEIFQDGNTITVTEGNNIQWYHNGMELSGETNFSLNINEIGAYSAFVTNIFDCQNTLSTEVTILGVSEFQDLNITISPNPFSDDISVTGLPELMKVECSTVDGIILFRADSSSLENKLLELNNGVFIISIFNRRDEVVSVHKVVKV
jgi:uncharacterized repeat protein (TIGR01451 family)